MNIQNAKILELDSIKQMNEFKEKYGDWPRSHDIPALSKRLERYFGGIVAFRKKHNLGYHNYTTGEYRSSLTKEFNIRGNKMEDEMFDFLVGKYGRVNVHREYLLYSNTKNRADFCVFKDNEESLIIDVFYPKDIRSFKSCINAKIKKYKKFDRCNVFFIQMNNSLLPNDTDYAIYKKDIPLEENRKVMSLQQFKEYVV